MQSLGLIIYHIQRQEPLTVGTTTSRGKKREENVSHLRAIAWQQGKSQWLLVAQDGKTSLFMGYTGTLPSGAENYRAQNKISSHQ